MERRKWARAANSSTRFQALLLFFVINRSFFYDSRRCIIKYLCHIAGFILFCPKTSLNVNALLHFQLNCFTGMTRLTHLPLLTMWILLCSSSSSTELKRENRRSVFAAVTVTVPPLDPVILAESLLVSQVSCKEVSDEWDETSSSVTSQSGGSPLPPPPAGAWRWVTFGSCQNDCGRARCFIGKGSGNNNHCIVGLQCIVILIISNSTVSIWIIFYLEPPLASKLLIAAVQDKISVL